MSAPLVLPAEWAAAFEAAEWQCQADRPGSGRCPHTGKGPNSYRLYLITVNGVPTVLCEPHTKKRGAADRAKTRETSRMRAATIVQPNLFEI